MEGKEVYKKILVDFLVALAGILFLIFILPKGIGFFLPFVIGGIIALIANPLVKFMEKRMKIVRKHSSILIIVLAIAAVVLVLYFGCTFLVRQIASLVGDLPELYAQFSSMINVAADEIRGLLKLLPESSQNFMDTIGENIMTYLGKAVSNASGITIGDAGVIVRNLAEGFLMAIFSLMSAYFFIAERERLTKVYKAAFPETLQKQVKIIRDTFANAIGGYFKAQMKIMIIILIILFAGFEFLKVDYSFLLALLVSLLDFLPFFGTGTVIGPWAVIDLFNGNYYRAICLLIIYVICLVAHQALQPKLVGDSIGLDPFTTLIFMFVGYRFKGVLGMIIGIPVGMAVIGLFKAGLFDKLLRGARIIIHDVNEYRKY